MIAAMAVTAFWKLGHFDIDRLTGGMSYGEVGEAMAVLRLEINTRRNDEGQTLLLAMAEWGDPSHIQTLIGFGADVDAKAQNGWTALHYAVVRPDAVRELLRYGANPNLKDEDGFTSLHLAASIGEVRGMEALIGGGARVDAKADDDTTPLYLAARFGHLAAVKALIHVGARVDARTKNGQTPLHVAADYGHVGTIRALVKGGAKVNARAKGMGNMTPLHFAAGSGHPGAVVALLRAGANPMAEMAETITPLLAAKIEKNSTEGDVRGHYEVIKILTPIEIGIRKALRPSRRPPR